MIQKIAGAALLILGLTSAATAQPKHRISHVGLVYPLSTNGVEAKEISNDFSLHAIGGVSAGESAFCVSGFSNVIFGNADGFVAAGFLNHVKEDNNGALLGGFLNSVGGSASGFQAAGFLNIAGSMDGAQMAGFANISRSNAYGLQMAGFTNIAYNTDVQLSGFIGIAKDVSVTQISGFAGVAADAETQFSGFVNVAKNVNTQLAGFVNIAKDVKSVQMAGFINIAEHSDYPIGLVNIVKNGEMALGVNVDESLTTMLSLRSGGKVLYGIIGLGYNYTGDDILYGVEAGLGAHLNIYKGFRINFEANYQTLTDFSYDNTYFKSSARMMPSITIAKRIELFAGPTIQVSERDIMAPRLTNTDFWQTNHRGRLFGMGIGGVAGMQVHF